MERIVATAFGIGYLRPASGTWASLAAVLLGWAIYRYLGFVPLAIATVGVSILGFYVCRRLLQPGQDPSWVVVDEVAGQWIALLFPASAFFLRGFEGWLPWPAPLAAFLFFRLFDIWKPGPIGRADRRGDADGVMWDDILAGLFAGVASILAAAAYHIPMALLK